LEALANPLSPGAGQAFLTLLTSQFIHANLVHILGNMLFLWIFGDNIEDILGSFTYLIYYLIFGVIAGLSQTFLLAPFLGGMGVPSIGASGAIAGVLGAYLVLFPGARVRAIIPPLIFLSFSVPAVIMIGLWFILQFFSGAASLTAEAAQSGGVAYWAHVGGFIAGIVMILPFWGRAREIKAAESQPYFAAPPDNRFR
jgi:membrane associated rhomboid family serine protease